MLVSLFGQSRIFLAMAEDGLLGLGRNGDGKPFLNALLSGFDAGEPGGGGWVGGASEEGDDEEVVDRLRGGQVGVEPELVAGLEVGNRGDGQGDAATGDMDVDFRAGEVEASLAVSRVVRGEEDQKQKQHKVRQTPQGKHSSSLDGVGGRWDGEKAAGEGLSPRPLRAPFARSQLRSPARRLNRFHVPRLPAVPPAP